MLLSNNKIEFTTPGYLCSGCLDKMDMTSYTIDLPLVKYSGVEVKDFLNILYHGYMLNKTEADKYVVVTNEGDLFLIQNPNVGDKQPHGYKITKNIADFVAEKEEGVAIKIKPAEYSASFTNTASNKVRTEDLSKAIYLLAKNNGSENLRECVKNMSFQNMFPYQTLLPDLLLSDITKNYYQLSTRLILFDLKTESLEKDKYLQLTEQHGITHSNQTLKRNYEPIVVDFRLDTNFGREHLDISQINIKYNRRRFYPDQLDEIEQLSLKEIYLGPYAKLFKNMFKECGMRATFKKHNYFLEYTTPERINHYISKEIQVDNKNHTITYIEKPKDLTTMLKVMLSSQELLNDIILEEDNHLRKQEKRIIKKIKKETN